ncbi:hypothetical protein CCH79_00011366 [Gambusia affinis]|uniref:Uncharacterized protein n=1 Tax=Gambusia affinis TaxID=33528 RepID=A0A315V1X3_GAMAF|nr:hypothetical protein CCH79_00011366 [Gambusia affinis]
MAEPRREGQGSKGVFSEKRLIWSLLQRPQQKVFPEFFNTLQPVTLPDLTHDAKRLAPFDVAELPRAGLPSSSAASSSLDKQPEVRGNFFRLDTDHAAVSKPCPQGVSRISTARSPISYTTFHRCRRIIPACGFPSPSQYAAILSLNDAFRDFPSCSQQTPDSNHTLIGFTSPRGDVNAAPPGGRRLKSRPRCRRPSNEGSRRNSGGQTCRQTMFKNKEKGKEKEKGTQGDIQYFLNSTSSGGFTSTFLVPTSLQYEDPERCFSMFGCGSGDAEPESEPEDLSDLEGQYDDDPSAMSRGSRWKDVFWVFLGRPVKTLSQ